MHSVRSAFQESTPVGYLELLRTRKRQTLLVCEPAGVLLIHMAKAHFLRAGRPDVTSHKPSRCHAESILVSERAPACGALNSGEHDLLALQIPLFRDVTSIFNVVVFEPPLKFLNPLHGL